MKDSAKNPFELAFREAAIDPARRSDFDSWVASTDFFVPAAEATASQSGSMGSAAADREIDLTQSARIRFKAYSENGLSAVPFFSDRTRFESWSAPDPQGRFVRLKGKSFFSLLSPQSAAILNPGSPEFSKWFTADEIRAVIAARPGIQSETWKLPVTSSRIAPEPGEALQIRRFFTEPEGPLALCVHGAIEDGRIFYTSGAPYRRLAPFLARRGWDVHVADLRGKGGSVPLISAGASHGQWEVICEQIPALTRAVLERSKGRQKIFWVAHSWGGVMMLAALARFSELRDRVAGVVMFGSKRSVSVWNLERLIKVSWAWNRFGPWLARRMGYLPARERGWGSQNETSAFLEQSVAWVKMGSWIDPVDGFDYGAAFEGATLPPQLHLAGTRDRALGHPDDVKRLIQETKASQAELWKLEGYGHIDMLSGPRAEVDHFERVEAWMRARLN